MADNTPIPQQPQQPQKQEAPKQAPKPVYNTGFEKSTSTGKNEDHPDQWDVNKKQQEEKKP